MIPNYLKPYKDLYETDPRKAAFAWFRQAKYGLFLHFGLYSLPGRHEWVQLKEKIPVSEYETLADGFTAEGFDAKAIVDLAVDAGMARRLCNAGISTTISIRCPHTRLCLTNRD